MSRFLLKRTAWPQTADKIEGPAFRPNLTLLLGSAVVRHKEICRIAEVADRYSVSLVNSQAVAKEGIRTRH